MIYPFFDRDLIELSLALPPGQRLQGGYTRSVLRRALDGILPAEVQWRQDKGELSAGVCLNLLEFEQEALGRMMADHRQIIRKYLDLDGLRAAYERFAANPVGHQSEAFTLMLAAGLARWLEVSKLSA
jgi:asparagine synthase (glutamine-hydrolysing)